MLPLAALATQSNLLGHDADYFATVALPANALWLAGLVCLAVTASRARSVPRAVGVALPFTWVATIPLSSLGGGVLGAAFWARLAWMLASERA